MPPRLSKRLQREQEELEALGKTAVVVDHWSEEEVTPDQTRKRTASSSGAAIGFAALLSEGDHGDEAEESEEEVVGAAIKFKKGKSKKKKKKAAQPEPLVSTQSPVLKSQKSRAKEHETSSSVSLKSGKQKAKEDDEFEKALAELSGKLSVSNLSSQTQNKLRELTHSQTLYSLLSVNLRNLDPEAELVRFFGSKVVASSGTATSTSSRTPRIRSNLAKPQANWPPVQYLGGLSMRELTPEEYQRKKRDTDRESKEKWWTIDANPRYKAITYEYYQCVLGGDPQFFFDLLQDMPWHADTLLQVAEVFRHREEYSSAFDLTSRALFAYERSFATAFNFIAGIHRLDFDHIENRVFYLALSRNIIDLNRRGTPQTAFEFARLLFGLDPHVDPHGSSLYLDSFAIKARQHDWLLKLWTVYEEMGTEESRLNVTLLPGWNWSKALALFEQEGDRDSAHVRSTEVLKTAILTFPTVAPLLADKLEINIKEELRRLDCFKIVTEYNSYRDDFSTSVMHLLSHIYVLRSHLLWKLPARADWFSKTLASIPISSFSSTPLISQTRFKDVFSVETDLTDSFYRHAIVASTLLPDFRRLSSFFPPAIKTRMMGNVEGDPLPPTSVVTAYTDAYFIDSPVDARRREQANQSLREYVVDGLRRIFNNEVGEFEARRMEGVMQQFPQFAVAFPEGIEQFRRRFRENPNEALNLVAGDPRHAQDGGILGGQPAMPGDLDEDVNNITEPEAAVQNENDEDEEQWEEEHAEYFPVRMIRNLAGRIWGRSNENQNEDLDSESDAGDPTTNPAHEVD